MLHNFQELMVCYILIFIDLFNVRQFSETELILYTSSKDQNGYLLKRNYTLGQKSFRFKARITLTWLRTNVNGWMPPPDLIYDVCI